MHPPSLDPVVHLELHTGNLVEVIERARALGAAVALEPREGPVGWRSILAVPSGAQIALWQSKL
jgi:predicted enzyme related to lactoylglutathione lyase